MNCFTKGNLNYSVQKTLTLGLVQFIYRYSESIGRNSAIRIRTDFVFGLKIVTLRKYWFLRWKLSEQKIWSSVHVHVHCIKKARFSIGLRHWRIWWLSIRFVTPLVLNPLNCLQRLFFNYIIFICLKLSWVWTRFQKFFTLFHQSLIACSFLNMFLGERSEAYLYKDTSKWFRFFLSVTYLCVSSL